MASKARQAGYGYKELLADIKRGSYASIYLFLGEEEFLAAQGVTALKKALLQQDDYSWNLAEFGGKEIDADEVVAFLNTLPIFGAKRVAVVEDFHQWKAADTESLLPLLEDMPDYAHLILVSPSIDKRTKCYRALNAQGQVVDVSPLEAPAATTWLMERGQELGLKLSRKVAQHLVNLVGLSLWQLDKELEKLVCYKDEHDLVVTEEDITQIAIPGREVADNAIFRFTDAVAAGAKSDAMALLQQLLASGREPQEIGRELGVPSFAVQRALVQGQRVGSDGIRGALMATFQTDREIKSGYHPSDRALEILVVRLTEGLRGAMH